MESAAVSDLRRGGMFIVDLVCVAIIIAFFAASAKLLHTGGRTQ